MYISVREFPASSDNHKLPLRRDGGASGANSLLPFLNTTTSKTHTHTRTSNSYTVQSIITSSEPTFSPVPTSTSAVTNALPVSTNPPIPQSLADDGLLTEGCTDGCKLNGGAIIGITMASIVAFVLIVGLLDIFLLSSRIQRLIKRSALPRPPSPINEKSKPPQLPPLPSRVNTIKRKPLPSPSVPFYDKEIKHSRSLSLDSLSSKYSRSTWGWSGATTLRDSKEWLRKNLRQSVNTHHYAVFEDGDDEKWIEEQVGSYKGGIRPGMGVQRRYTGNSFFLDEEKGSIERDFRGRREKLTWMLLDPLERWRKGLHPLGGKRGAGFERIGYF